MDDITALNELYKIVAMGIIGIDEVKGHIEDKALAKTMVDAKKKYMVNKMDITNMLNELGERPTEINIIIKAFNEIYTGIELIKCDDAKIAKMLTEGTNKGIIKVEEILNNNIPDYSVCVGKTVNYWNSNITFLCKDNEEKIVSDWLSNLLG